MAFRYCWENADELGYNRATYLRFEGGKIYLHDDLGSLQVTPAQANNSDYLSTATSDKLLKTWNDGDLLVATAL